MANAVEIPKALFDYTVRQQIRTGRYASKVVRDIIGLLNKADAEILDKISRTEAPFSKARLQALLKETRITLYEIYSEAGNDLKQQMLNFAGVQAEATAAMLATRLPVSYNIIQTTTEQLKAIVDVAPVTVGPDKKLLLEEIFTSLAAGKEEAIRGAIRLGMVEGETTSEMVRRLKGTRAAQYKDGVLEVSRRHCETMTRTIVNHTSNQAMQAVYNNNADVVKGWTFTSTLDARTSITCASLSGTQWPAGQGPIPPRHPNCRSVAIPDIKTWRELGVDIDEIPAGMRSSKDGPIKADISFNDWLKGQDKSTQIDILGKSRQELFASGKLTVDKFTDIKGRVLTLDQLKEVHGVTSVTKTKYMPNKQEFIASSNIKEAKQRLLELVTKQDYSGTTYKYGTNYRHAKSLLDSNRDVISGASIKLDSVEEANAIIKTLESIQQESDRIGVPNIRSLAGNATIKKNGSMGDGVLTLRTGRPVIKDALDASKIPWSASESIRDEYPVVSTMWHEFAHHIHQQLGRTSRGSSPLEHEIKAFRVTLQKNGYKFTYPTKYSYENSMEFFAENYAMIKTGREDLADKEMYEWIKSKGLL